MDDTEPEEQSVIARMIADILRPDHPFTKILNDHPFVNEDK